MCLRDRSFDRGPSQLVFRLKEPSGVHADAPPAAQQPAEDRIEELDLGNLSCRGPADQREDKAETLRLVRQRGVSTRPVKPRTVGKNAHKTGKNPQFSK